MADGCLTKKTSTQVVVPYNSFPIDYIKSVGVP